MLTQLAALLQTVSCTYELNPRLITPRKWYKIGQGSAGRSAEEGFAQRTAEGDFVQGLAGTRSELFFAQGVRQ